MGHPLLKRIVPLPDLSKVHSAVFVGPHPDDIEIGAGGTAHKLIARGCEVAYIICTDGGCGSLDPDQSIEELAARRRQESLEAGKSMGVKTIHFLDFPDGGEYRAWDVAVKIAALLAQIRPDIVFCPDPELPSETHPDHIRTAKAAKTAAMLICTPLILKQNGIPFDKDHSFGYKPASLAYYYTHRPNQIVPLSKEDIEAKNAAIVCHQSQFPSGSREWKMLSTYLKLRQARFGFRVLHRQAEDFFMMSPAHQHSFPEVNNF
jgi:LmbE family N-acetylglucosaminyl deacetylase